MLRLGSAEFVFCQQWLNLAEMFTKQDFERQFSLLLPAYTNLSCVSERMVKELFCKVIKALVQK